MVRVEPLFVAFAVLALMLTACQSSSSGEPAAAASPTTQGTGCPATVGRLGPGDGTLFGLNLDWARDTPAAASERLGREPAVYVLFASYPPTPEEWKGIEEAASTLLTKRAALLLTLEPMGGLSTVTAENAAALASHLATYNSRGLPVYLRFGHEMNGSWYPWSQQPEQYAAAFQLIANAVHRAAPLTATVWAPNYGGGYPFGGGRYNAVRGGAAYASLDTNHDGQVSSEDDPYAPYYPGDDSVDWVGISLYHWGNAYPWGENEMPEGGKFVAQLRGLYSGVGGDETAVPDFYGLYAEGRGKPLAITETAAFYEPGEPGAPAASIKEAWWTQVFAAVSELPGIRMVNWFEWSKFEGEVNHEVDWTVSNEPSMAGRFAAALPPRFLFAPLYAGCPGKASKT
ncbi:MAG: glycosyl hydrolase [Tepidiformaceae bacterium]